MGTVRYCTQSELDQIARDKARLDAEANQQHYIKIRVREGSTQWNAIVPVSRSFLNQKHSYLEWQSRLIERYAAFSGIRVDRVLQSGEVSEDEANEWWMDRDTYGRPIPQSDRPSPEDCF